MLGFRNQSEDDIEDVNDGIHRTIERGNIDKVKAQQKLDCYMNLQLLFPSPKQEKKRIRKEEEVRAEKEKLNDEIKFKKGIQIVSTKDVCIDREKV